jgi:hypothetical protein
MRVREAKDFLVEQIRQQALQEGVPLDDLEIRMLYFTEKENLSGETAKLVEDFDQAYNAPAYEKKISRLMQHAYRRLKKGSNPDKDTWNDAIRCLKKGDHYILVMWGNNSILVGICLAVGSLLVYGAFVFLARWFQQSFSPPNPHILLGVFLALIAIGFLFPRRLGKALGWIFDQTIGRFIGPNDKRDEEA